MNPIIQELQETLKANDTVHIFVDTKPEALWIQEIEKIYDEKWFLAKHPSGNQNYLINVDHISHVEI